MESQLTVITSQSSNREAPDTFGESNNKDYRPLLKPEAIRSEEEGVTVEKNRSRSQQRGNEISVEELEKKYAAFVRKDVYGMTGRGELSVWVMMMLGLGMVTTILVLYYLICRATTLFKAPNREVENEQEDYAHMGGLRSLVIFQCGRFFSRVMVFVFGFNWIKVTVRHPDAVTKLSVHVILLHVIARKSKSSDFKGVEGVVTERVREAHQNKDALMMMLFPEGTTTNGDYLLPFKMGAFLSKAPVLPVILRYPYRRRSPAWDSISGVTRLPIYYPSEKEKDNPKLYADNVRQLMATEGHPIMSDIGKRMYQAALNG